MTKNKLDKEQKEELKIFLEYLQDKIEDCYSKETEQAIKNFLKRI